MASLDVALRLRLINGLSGPAKEAGKDLHGIGDAAKRLSGSAGGLTALGTATARFGHELGRVTVSAAAADGSVRRLGAERSGLSALGATTAQFGQELGRVTASAGQADASLRRLGAERAGLAGLDAVTKALSADLNQVAGAATRADEAVRRLGRDHRGRFVAAGRPASDFDPTLFEGRRRDYRGRFLGADGVAQERPGQPRKRAGDGLNVAAAGNRAVGGLVGGIGVAGAYKSSAAFDRRMTMIGQTAEAGRAEIDALGARVHDLAQETATPVDKVAGGLEALVAQGRSLKEGLDFLPSVARTAAASGAEVSDIAKSADSVGTNFDIAGKRMQTAFDIMAAGGKAGQFELKDMARYIPSLSPAAKAQGFKGEQGLADIVAMLQIIRKGSGTSEEAATSMTNIFQKLNSEETIKNFKKMGVDLDEALKKGRKEGANLVQVLEDVTQQATKGDLSLLPKLFKDQEFHRGMLALMTYRGEWQKLSGTLQTTSGGTVLRDLVQVTKDAQASIDRMSNSWNRFIQGASRAADAGGVSAGLGDTAKEFQAIAEALERVNKAYAEGGLKGALKQAAGDAGERIKSNRKDWLNERERQENARIAEMEADNKAFIEKLVREGRSPEEIASTKRLREAEVEKARRRLGSVERAKADPRLADAKPLRMGVDPTAPIQGKPGPVGIGTVEFNNAFPLDLRREQTVPLPPSRPRGLKGGTGRGIDSIDDVLGPQAEKSAPRPFDRSRFDIPDAALRPAMEGAMRALAERIQAQAARFPTKVGTPTMPGADAGIAPKLGGAGAFPLAPDLSKAFDPAPLRINVDAAINEAGRLRTGLAQDLSEPARQSMEKYTTALKAGTDAAIAIGVAAAAQLRSALSFTATPTIAPRLGGATGGGAPGAGATASPASARAAPSPAPAGGGAPRLQTASLRGGGDVHINGPVHVHGAGDMAAFQRQISRQANARARDERDARLHDLGSSFA